MIIIYLLAAIGALTVASFGLLIAWVLHNALADAREARRHRAMPPALSVDGRPLDDDEKRRLASVWIGLMNSPDDDSSDVRKDHQ